MKNEITYTVSEILEELGQVSNWLIIGDSEKGIPSEPFYAHFFSGLVKKVGFEGETLTVAYHNEMMMLFVNPVFWKNYLPSELYKLGVVKHEILHIVFKHIFRYQDFKNKILFNIAADIVVNQYILRKHLIDGAVFLEDFPDLNFEKDQDVKYYYQKLLDFYESRIQSGFQDDNNASWNKLKSLMDQNQEIHQKHIFWKDLENMSNAEKEILESAINQAIENAIQKGKPEIYGNFPVGLKQYLKEFQLNLKPVVNWRRILRIFSNNSVKTEIRNTLRRPSNRYGTNPGIKVKKKQKILIAIDTSGSIMLDELKAFFSEVYHIWKMGAEIMVTECDTKIHHTYHYSGKTPTQITGRGGTNFEEPILYANTVYHPDALIYFTDGFGPVPDIQSNCPLLWLISSNGAKTEEMKLFQGRKLKIS